LALVVQVELVVHSILIMPQTEAIVYFLQSHQLVAVMEPNLLFIQVDQVQVLLVMVAHLQVLAEQQIKVTKVVMQ
jgi:hypothetical protein